MHGQQNVKKEPNIVNVIKSSRLAGHVVRMDGNELPKRIVLDKSGGQGGRGRPKSRWIDGVEEDARKVSCRNCGRMYTIEVADDICLRKPRPKQGCRADDDGDESTLFTIPEKHFSFAPAFMMQALWKLTCTFGTLNSSEYIL